MASDLRTITVIQAGKASEIVDLRIKVLNLQTTTGRENDILCDPGGRSVCLGRWHQDDDHGETRIYWGQLEVVKNNTEDIIKGLTVQIENKQRLPADGDWSEFKWTNGGQPTTCVAYYHHGDENHSFRFYVGTVKLIADATGEEIPITVTPGREQIVSYDSSMHFFNAYQYHCLWTKFWRGYGNGDENTRTDYGESSFTVPQCNLTKYGASLP